MAHSNVYGILRINDKHDLTSVKEALQYSIDNNKCIHRVAQYRHNPCSIISPIDFAYNSVTTSNSSPTYVTDQTIQGELVNREAHTTAKLVDSIVLIWSAGPGWDWIFSRNIKGFITCYGGSNSHMVIRASEFNIPAVVGVGEQLYAELLLSKTARICCSTKAVHI